MNLKVRMGLFLSSPLTLSSSRSTSQSNLDPLNYKSYPFLCSLVSHHTDNKLRIIMEHGCRKFLHNPCIAKKSHTFDAAIYSSTSALQPREELLGIGNAFNLKSQIKRNMAARRQPGRCQLASFQSTIEQLKLYKYK